MPTMFQTEDPNAPDHVGAGVPDRHGFTPSPFHFHYSGNSWAVEQVDGTLMIFPSYPQGDSA